MLLLIAAVPSIVVSGTGPNQADALSDTTGKARTFIIVSLNSGIAVWTEHTFEVSEIARTGEREDLAKSCKLKSRKREPGKADA